MGEEKKYIQTEKIVRVSGEPVAFRKLSPVGKREKGLENRGAASITIIGFLISLDVTIKRIEGHFSLFSGHLNAVFCIVPGHKRA